MGVREHRRGQTPSPAATATRAVEPRRRLGRLGEQLAAAHLERLGYTVLARNVRTRHGEIDLIASDARVLAFVEVKARQVGSADVRSRRVGTAGVRLGCEPLLSLRPRQRARLRRLAAAWLRDTRERPHAHAIRFDAIGVIVGRDERLLRLDHIEGAW
jgi:putative endonuclease